MEAANDKSKNIFEKIWNKLKSIWKKIKNFFVKHFGKSKNTTEKNKKILGLLIALPAGVLAAGLGGAVITKKANEKNDENTTEKESPKSYVENGKIKEILDIAWKDEYKNDGIMIAANQPFNKNIKNNVLNQKKYRYALDMLSAALSDTEIVIKPNGDKKIMSIEDLVFAFEYVANITNGSVEKDVADIKKYLNNTMNTAISKGINVKVDPDEIDNTKAKLEEISTKMDQLLKESVDVDIFTEADKRQKKKFAKQAEEGRDTPQVRQYQQQEAFKKRNADDQKMIAEGVTGLKFIYTDIMVIAGNVMKMYNDIENYRAEVGNKLEKYLSTTTTKTLVNE